MASLTIENYVKTIYQICNHHQMESAGTGQIAEALSVAPGSVTSMLKTLDESGLAVYTPYEGVQLTERGNALALRIVRRHRLIEQFLVKTLKLSWDEVHEEAENMEHAVSDALIDRIDEYLGKPEFDPHGDPIPQANGAIPSPDSRSLLEWETGVPFRLIRVMDQTSEFLRYLTTSGLRLGVEGTILDNCDQAGVMTIVIEGRETTVAHQSAQKLMVADAKQEV